MPPGAVPWMLYTRPARLLPSCQPKALRNQVSFTAYEPSAEVRMPRNWIGGVQGLALREERRGNTGTDRTYRSDGEIGQDERIFFTDPHGAGEADEEDEGEGAQVEKCREQIQPHGRPAFHLFTRRSIASERCLQSRKGRGKKKKKKKKTTQRKLQRGKVVRFHL